MKPTRDFILIEYLQSNQAIVAKENPISSQGSRASAVPPQLNINTPTRKKTRSTNFISRIR
jgi:hypothetical protein